jgi:hypothetical protein
MSAELVRSNTLDVYKSPTASMLTVCGKAMALLDGQALTKDNVIIVLRTVMEAIDTIILVDRVDKKILALDCLHWLVNQQNMKDSDRLFMIEFVDLVAPPAIEVIIAATKGLTQINLAKKWCCFN